MRAHEGAALFFVRGRLLECTRRVVSVFVSSLCEIAPGRFARFSGQSASLIAQSRQVMREGRDGKREKEGERVPTHSSRVVKEDRRARASDG